MKRHILIGYFVASAIAMLVSNWMLLPPTYSVFSLLLWIASGPIGIMGFVTLGPLDWGWAAKNAFYYLAATSSLAGCLWLVLGTSGARRYVAVSAMALIWLACSAYIFEFLSWAA